MQNTRKLLSLASQVLKRTQTTAAGGTEQTTHFGYQTVKESEKEHKGKRGRGFFQLTSRESSINHMFLQCTRCSSRWPNHTI